MFATFETVGVIESFYFSIFSRDGSFIGTIFEKSFSFLTDISLKMARSLSVITNIKAESMKADELFLDL